MALTFNSDRVVSSVKNIISTNDLEEKSSLRRIIESMKNMQLNEQKDRLFKVFNMRNNKLFNNMNENPNINDKTKYQNYPLYQYMYDLHLILYQH